VRDTGDDALLAGARGGDDEAVAALVRRYQPRIYRFSMKMCRRPEDAEDVLQDTLLAMARTVRDFRGASSVSTWLYTIARSFCIKKRRRSKFAPPAEVSLDSDRTEAVAEVPDKGLTPDRLVESHEIQAELERAVASLPAPQREVLVLRDIEGLSAAEVAEITGLSVDAVKSRLHRARATVRERLAPFLGVSGARPAAAGCPDIIGLFSRHLEGDIDAGVCADMERHIAGCAVCRSACESLKRTLGLCRSTPAPEVPAELQQSIRQAIRGLLARA
jgi:RNA polymerase sigma-70 factor (ECF subfamily)